MKPAHHLQQKALRAAQDKKLQNWFEQAAIDESTQQLCQQILDGQTKNISNQYSRENILQTLNAPLSEIQSYCLEKLLPQIIPTNIELKENDRIFLAGKLGLGLTQLAFMLRKAGLSLSRKYNKNCTHILLGILPGEKLKTSIDSGLPLILETNLTQLIEEKAHQHFYLMNKKELETGAQESIDLLLQSEEDSNFQLALQIMSSSGISEETLPKFLAVCLDRRVSYDLRKKAGEIFHKYYPSQRVSNLLQHCNYFKNIGGLKRLITQLPTKSTDLVKALIDRKIIGIESFVLHDIEEPELRQKVLLNQHDGDNRLHFKDRILRLLNEADKAFLQSQTAFGFAHIHEIPDFLWNCKKLKKLWLNGTVFQTYPNRFDELINLEELSLTNWYDDDPINIDSISKLPKLRTLRIFHSNIMNLKGLLSGLTQLEKLILNNCGLKTIPTSIFRMQKLRKLSLVRNLLEQLPVSITDCQQLCELDLSYNYIYDIPNLKNLKNLAKLTIQNWRGNYKYGSTPQLAQYLPANCRLIQ